MRAALGGPVPEQPTAGAEVIAALAAAAEPGLVATASGRFFGFVFGGATPAALAADWLTATWDQNAGLYATSPAAAVVEEVAGGWLIDLLGLPARRLGRLRDRRADGQLHRPGGGPARGAAPGRLGRREPAASPARHRSGSSPAPTGTTPSTGRCGSSASAPTRSPRSRPTTRAGCAPTRWPPRSTGHTGPAIVCAQAGNVNSGAVDPVGRICDLAHEAGAWVHVDGAFGLWAAASPALRPLLAGVERADSWATDAHKWLNVPYDSGLVFCAHPRPTAPRWASAPPT